MDCKDVLELLDSYVDSELDVEVRSRVREHIEICPRCQTAYGATTNLKRLVQRRSFQPPVPGGVSARILRKIRESETPGRNRLQSVTTALAATVTGLLVGWLTLSVFFDYKSPLAHADVVKVVAERFSGSRSAGVPVTDLDSTLQEIREKTGVPLTRLPTIPGARLVSWKKEQIDGRDCACLAYRDDQSAAVSRPAIMIFAVRAQDVERLNDNFHPCVGCTELPANTTIFCYQTTGGTSLNLVTSLQGDGLADRFEAIER